MLGKEIGSPFKDLIAKKAKACDSIKSPSILYLSIGSRLIFLKLCLILSNRYLFFLPPPHTNHLLFLSFIEASI